MKRPFVMFSIVAILISQLLCTPHAIAQDDCSVSDDKQLVLFVHGFGANEDAWDKNAIRDKVNNNPRLSAKTFNYEDSNTQWVTNPNIGSKLAARINCLADSSKKSGGSGKVIVIAHSMGGLAALEASKKTNKIGMLTSLSTPYLGSPITNAFTFSKFTNFTTWMYLTVACSINKQAEVCKYLVQLESPAAKAMSMGSQELRNLPKLASDVPVRAIAGEVWAGDVSLLGDMIVPTRSALAGASSHKAGGAFTVRCSFKSGTLQLPGCSHSEIYKDEEVANLVISGINTYISTLPIAQPVQPAPPPVVTKQDCGGLGLLPSIGYKVRVKTEGLVTCQEAIKIANLVGNGTDDPVAVEQVKAWQCTFFTAEEVTKGKVSQCQRKNDKIIFEKA